LRFTEQLETPRLYLRPYNPEIMRRLFGEKSNKELITWLGAANEQEVQQERQNFEKGVETYKTSFHFFHLIDKESEKTIGWCGYHMWFTHHDRAELGYTMTDESFRGKGLMKEALKEVLRYGLEEMGLRRIEALTSHDNDVSKKLLLDNGFEFEGVLKGHYKVNDVMEDSLMYALLK
jgi:ribosomal-protein-alanine N-acetyltransferase